MNAKNKKKIIGDTENIIRNNKSYSQQCNTNEAKLEYGLDLLTLSTTQIPQLEKIQNKDSGTEIC